MQSHPCDRAAVEKSAGLGHQLFMSFDRATFAAVKALADKNAFVGTSSWKSEGWRGSLRDLDGTVVLSIVPVADRKKRLPATNLSVLLACEGPRMTGPSALARAGGRSESIQTSSVT
jgi:hypothetical protein